MLMKSKSQRPTTEDWYRISYMRIAYEH